MDLLNNGLYNPCNGEDEEDVLENLIQFLWLLPLLLIYNIKPDIISAFPPLKITEIRFIKNVANMQCI